MLKVEEVFRSEPRAVLGAAFVSTVKGRSVRGDAPVPDMEISLAFSATFGLGGLIGAGLVCLGAAKSVMLSRRLGAALA